MYCIGLQHGVVLRAEPYGLGLNETLVSQYLKGMGYATHAVGKVSANASMLVQYNSINSLFYLIPR